MNQELVRKYAEFVVKVGVNVQPRQTLIIRCPVEQAPIARICAQVGFEAGAKDVVVRYEDEKLTRIRYEQGAEADLTSHKPSALRAWLDYAEDPDGCCLLALRGADPQIFEGLDVEKVNRVALAGRLFMKPWQEYTMKDRIQWCIAALPCPAWAAKVFPELSPEEGVERLWAAIFKVCRVDPDTDPVENWKAHVEKLTRCAKALNEYHLDRLHFTSGNGTDLWIGLAQDAVWEAAQSRAENGAVFIANIPTEEVYTAPHRLRVDGKVYGTKPYVYNGQLIEDFWVEFKEGRVVSHGAAKNDDLLAQLLESDENACRIGEVALVPASSPVNQSGLLFYDTLFDENAACHIAFGDGYPGTVAGGNDMTPEQLLEKGVNASAVHEDVMIGAGDTDITGFTADGREIPIFRQGEWVLQ